MTEPTSKYAWMPLSKVLEHEDEMERLKVSEVARSSSGFLTAYKNKKTKDAMRDWWRKRDGFISRHLAQYKTNPTPRRRLALRAWAYDP
jgi:hypothetical protein